MTVRLERRPHRNRDKRGGEEGRGKEEIEIRRDENKSGVRRERDENLTISPSLLFSCLDSFCLFYSLLYFSPYPTFILISSHLYLHFYSTLFSSPLLAFNGVSSSLQPSHLFSPFLFFSISSVLPLPYHLSFCSPFKSPSILVYIFSHPLLVSLLFSFFSGFLFCLNPLPVLLQCLLSSLVLSPLHSSHRLLLCFLFFSPLSPLI